MTNPPDLIIFDCDGVLVDSEIIGINLTLSLLQQQGITVTFDDYCARYSGLTWDVLIATLEADKGVRLPATLPQTFHTQLLAAFREKLTRIAGTYEVISRLSLQKCICSNSARAQVELALSLTGLRERFGQAIFSAADLGTGRGKPRPDIFLQAAETLGASPARTLVVEDSVHGVMAAKRAGMFVVGFTGGAHSWPQHQRLLLAAGADRVIDSLFLLPEEIARYSRRSSE